MKKLATFSSDWVEDVLINGGVKRFASSVMDGSLFLKTYRGLDLEAHILAMVVGATAIMALIFSAFYLG